MKDSHRTKLSRFYWAHNRMPSFSEMAGLFGFASKNAVSKVVNRLVEEGIVQKDKTGRLIPGASLKGLAIRGTVGASFPSPAEEELVDVITLDEYLIHNHEATFMLNVSGDSMIDAGIHPGDIVLLERGKTPKHGDIVVAQVDHAWTMKYYEKKGKQVRLVPANKAYPMIFPKEELTITGVVVGVVRRYV